MKGIRITNPKDFGAGIMFAAFGAAFVFIARDYEFGTPMRMGPAYFPTILGCLLILIGLATAARGLMRAGKPIGALAVRPAILITLATVLFGALVEKAGMIVAGTLIAFIGAYASSYFRWRWAAPLSIGLAAVAALIFVTGLGLPLPVVGDLFGLN